jgi:hypothetical protein
MYAALVAATVVFSSVNAFAQQLPPMIASAAGAPLADGWSERAPRVSRAPARPVVVVPTEEALGKVPPTIGVEKREGAEVKKEVDCGIHDVIGEDTFLLAVRHHGFWAMPPGGFTRYLIGRPIPINPDSTLADPLVASLRP